MNRKLGGVLVGVGGLGTLLALLCCIAPWLFAGFLVALGLGFVNTDAVLLSIAGLGLLVAILGLWLRRKHPSRQGGAA